MLCRTPHHAKVFLSAEKEQKTTDKDTKRAVQSTTRLIRLATEKALRSHYSLLTGNCQYKYIVLYLYYNFNGEEL